MDPLTRRRIMALASVAAATGCGTGIVANRQPGDESLGLRLDFVDLQMQPIDARTLRQPPTERVRMRHVRAPDPIELLFLAVPGRVAGPAAELVLRRRLRAAPGMLETDSQLGFAINLGYLQRALQRFAAPYQARSEDLSVRTEPAITGIARIALAVAEPGQTQPYAALCGFIDAANGQEYLLLWSDRPCHITGEVDLRQSGTFADTHTEMRQRFTGLFHHEIELPRSGLHWLSLAPTGERRWLIRRADAPRAPFVYVLDARTVLG